jgi:hypothetical protein
MPARTFCVALLMASTRAFATDFCVQNDTQLQTALAYIGFAGGPNRILLGAGKTLHLANTILDNPDAYDVQQLTIAGGYDATCSAQITQDAASSVLDGTGLNYARVEAESALALNSLTIAHLATQIWLNVYGDNARLRVQHVRVVDGGAIGVTAVDDDARITVSDSVFARMGGGTNDPALNLTSIGDGVHIDLVNTTVTASSRNGVRIYNPQGITSLYNNILYGNAPGFVDLDQNEAVLAFNNTIGSHDGGFIAGSANNLATNPLFVSATDYNLQFASPARDSGTPVVPGGLSVYDVEGGIRVVGATVDRGAYENDSTGATILLVTNTNDSGAGSLRQAILDSNANPVDNIIGFNIPGACPRTIAVNTELPAITDAVSIRGYTQPGSSPNGSGLIDNATLCVELVEASGHTVANGLHFVPAAVDSTLDVSGLAIGGFNTGIFIDDTNAGTGVGYSIWGNFIGLAANGSTLRANSVFGVDVRGRVYGTVGGDDNAQRNVIAGSVAGVRIATEATNWVTNNFIGTTAGGGTSRPNAAGVILLSPLNYVLDNVISGNTASGISMSDEAAAGNTIEGNRIGLKAFAACAPPCTPDYALGNGQFGIYITGGAYGTHIFDNTIAYNGTDADHAGVHIGGTGSTSNAIFANRIYDNAGLGIDLGSVGVDPIDNDATADHASANGGQNAPYLYQSTGGHHSGSVMGRLNTRDGAYHVDFYASPDCDSSGHGEGRYYLGRSDVTISGALPGENGQINFLLPIQGTQELAGMAITAVAIDNTGGSDWTRPGNTSEFSNCVTHQFIDYIFIDGFEDEGEGG